MPHVKESKQFKGGPLPDNCPPKDAVKTPKGATFLRLVPTNPATSDHLSPAKPRGIGDSPKSAMIADGRHVPCGSRRRLVKNFLV